MDIIITGGAGFIGSNLIRNLKERNHLIVIDNRSDLDSINDHIQEIDFFNIDILDYTKMKTICKNTDGIIHLAAVSRVIWGFENPWQCLQTNIQGTVNVLEAARKSNKKPWVIFGSSREVYGENGCLPVKEDAPYKPVNVYSVSKITAEMICEKYHQNYGLNVGIARFSNVYGGLFDILDRVIPRFVLSSILDEPIYFHGGNQLFDFTHIADTVEGLTKMIVAINNAKSNYFNKYQFLTGKPSSLQNIKEIIENKLRKEIDTKVIAPRSYDVVKFYGDPSKTKQELGFAAKVDIKTGIEKTIELYSQELNNNREFFESRMVWRK